MSELQEKHDLKTNVLPTLWLEQRKAEPLHNPERRMDYYCGRFHSSVFKNENARGSGDNAKLYLVPVSL